MTSSPQSATSAAPFVGGRHHFTAPLPRGLRKEADADGLGQFSQHVRDHSGPVRLGQWACTDDDRPATRLGPQPRNYRATLAIGDRISTPRRRRRARSQP